MKRLILLCLSFCMIGAAISQSLQVNYYTGIANGEMYNLKKNMLAAHLQIGGEIKISRVVLIEALVGFERINFDYYDNIGNQVFNGRTNFSFTLGFKHLFISIKNNGHFFYAIGISGNAAIKDKKEIFSSGSKTVVNKSIHGFNIGLQTDIGYRHILSKKIDVSVSLITQKDYYKKYRTKSDEIKYQRMLFAFGGYYKLHK